MRSVSTLMPAMRAVAMARATASLEASTAAIWRRGHGDHDHCHDLLREDGQSAHVRRGRRHDHRPPRCGR